jgi:hypothetical protein
MAGKSKGRKAERGGPSGMPGGSRSSGGGGGKKRGGGDDERSGYGQKIRARQIAKNTKGGCAPKLFMLVLPFVVAGTYFWLRS